MGMSGIQAVSHGGMSVAWRQFYYASRVSAARSAAANPARPERPVEPVSAIRRIAPDAAVRIPVTVREPRVPTEDGLNSAADTLARMRIRFPGEADTAPDARAI